MSYKNYILDAGHGGVNPDTGVYVTAPDKMHEFDDGFTIYEGVINRKICEKIINNLPKDINYDYITSGYRDVPLDQRNQMIERIGKECKGKAVVISVHCNWWKESDANGIQAHCYGTDGYISAKGMDIGNLYMKKAESLIEAYDGYKMNTRGAYPDNPVKPSNYAILRDHPYPAILTENGFMSNRDDAEFLKSEEGQEFIADIHIETIMGIENGEINI